MSRISKWKLEKTKVKVVFRLQFHATHIPQSGWDKLFISFIPADSGKATAKTTKANVRNGTCKWADPIYETTRLLQDAKTKLYDEKPYKLIVAVGSSRSSVLGEANINLADYADASKPSAVALPLIGCNSGAVLHVTVQLLTSKTGFREFEQQRELRERGLQTSTALNSHDEVGIVKVSSSGEPLNEQIDKVNAKVRFKRDSRELPSLEEEMGVNEEYADSATGFDGSSNTSESLCAEKHDTSSTHEVESLKSRVSGDIGGVSLGQSPRQEKGDSDHPLLAQRSNDWVHGWNSDCSVDNELANAYEGNFKLRGCSEVVESSIFKMKLEVSSLQNHADEIGAEIQKFDQQLFAEIASGKELANEVSILQAECSKLKDDLEYIKALKLKSELPGEETVKTDRIQDLQDLQLGWLKGLSFLEDKIREIQNKACLGYHERDFRFLLPDLESLLDVLQNLKKKSGGMTSLVNMVPADELKNVPVHNIEKLVLETGFNMDLNQSDELFHCSTVPGLVSCESESTDTSGAMKAKIFQLLRELDESKAEQEILVRKMGQMECYYEALVQELEENQKQVLGELQNLRNEHSTCLYTISSNEAQIEAMHQDMNEQIIRLAEERHALDLLNKQLERRVVISEAALKRARLNYSIAVDQLQKDLELLSLQVVSMFETNENLIKQTYTDAWEPIVVQNQELCSGISNCFQGQNHDVPMKNQCLGGDFVMEDMKRSLHFQDELFRKVEGELSEMHLVNVHLDVFSKALQEILFEASANFGVLNERVDELAQQLELSTKSKEILIVRLQDAMEDLHSVNEFKANYIARCNDLVLQNQILEEKLKNISDEKCLLIKKVEENEALLKEIRIFESKYEACAAENADLKNLLKQETLENDDLRDKLLGLQQEMKIVEADYDKLDSVKENLQKSVNLLQDELRRLLECSGKKFREAAQGSRSLSQNLEFGDFTSAILQLEELQNDTHQRILQLMEQKKDLEDERDIARESLRTTKSENLVLRQKLQYDKQDMLSKFEAVSAIMQKLQSELEMIANKVKMASDVEAQYAKQNRDLSSGIGILEVELQQLTSRNNDLAQEILALGTVIEELERVRLTNSELSGENQSLKMSLQNKAGESARLVLELNNLKESFNLLDQKMAVERDYRDKLEGRVSDLTSQLNETHDELHHFEQQKNELARFKQMIADLKSEKAEVCHRLLHYEKCLKEVSDVSLSIGDLETQLAGMHDNLLSADIELAISKTVYTGIVKELFQRLQSFTIQSKETERKYLDAETALNCSLSKEGKYIAENEKLVSAVETLRAELEAAERKYLNAETALNCSLSREGNYIEENEKLVSAVETLRAELEATERKYLDAEKALNCSLSREGKYIEENGKLVTAVETLSAELAAERRCLDAEAALNCSLSREGKCIEENAELITAVETLRAELEAAVKKYLDAETALNCSLSKEGKYIEENEKLVTAVETLRAELEAAVTQNGALIDSNRVVTAQLEECKNREAIPLVNFSIEKQQHALEIEWLKNMLISCEEEVDSLRISNEELEITTIVFKAKLSEQHAKLSTLKQHKDDLRMLQNQCNELSCKLSEQTLKTEEYKNLSIHLKELKDKADGENLQAREKRESEGQSVTMQESLRIAFIKEQYETRVQEMKQQLSISKRHSEELLWKLQDAVNEVENRKKSEVSHLKRNEELSLKVLELEAEMQAVLSDKREKVKAYDRVKAELDCSLLSLECCKEEKQNLEISLKECNEEKFRTTTELTMVKEMLEGCGSTCNVQVEQNNGPFIAGSMSNDSIAGKVCEKCGHAVTSMCTASDPMSIYGKQENSKNYDGVNDGNLIPVSEGKHSSLLQNAQSKQDVIASGGIHNIPNHIADHEELSNDLKQLVHSVDPFKCESFRSSMNHLHEELERMKNENSLLLEAYHHSDSKPQVLQRELMQLNKANEELGIMFPPFNELPESGNALERVLALEIELAEALKAKKRTNVQFQSSFLRQHGDEEAVFQSFKDINELLKDMLELKGRYSTVETELKEMHDRYSQLSLQFAEVEGERQKLMMTLKNVRASKKTLLNRSSSATLGENC